jgi:hypothetical protein
MDATDHPPTAEQHPVIFYTIEGFRKPRNIPHSSFYKLVKARKIRIVKRGRRSFVHVDEAKRYDKSLLSAA